MIQLVVEFDGLLGRFGRVVPDAVAMLAVVRHLQERLKAIPRAPRLAVQVVRFGGSPGDEAELGALRSELSRIGPGSVLSSLAASAVVAADLGELVEASSAAPVPDRVILLTTSHHRFQEAVTAGMNAYHVGLGTPPERRGLRFDEVPRMLEETLRVPTARPMAQGVRIGGLLLIPTGGPADAWARALSALLEDPTVDWVTVGSDLILYTEQPDLEDRLCEEPGVERLSYGVRKNALVIEPIAGAAGEGVLYEGHGSCLREAADVADSETLGASRPPSGWAAMRRRTLQDDPIALSPGPATLPADRYVSALRRFGPLLADGLGGRNGPPERLLAVLREIVGPSAAADLLLRREALAALTWTTPYGRADRDDLIALVHDATPTGDGDGEEALASEAAAALALADSLSSASSSAGVLHCLRLPLAMSIDELLAVSLQPEERNRLLAVVHLEGLSGLESEPRVLEITADPRLDRRPEQLPSPGWARRGVSGPARIHIRATGNGGPPCEGMKRLLTLVASIIG